MTSAVLLRATAAAILSRVTAAGGVLESAESLEEARDFLAATPARWRIILLWEGYGAHAAAREGMTTHQVTAVVQQIRGLPAANAAAPKLLTFSDRLEQVSAWIRSLRFPDGAECDSAGFALSDSRWLESAKSTRAHALSFSLVAALPALTETIPVSLSSP